MLHAHHSHIQYAASFIQNIQKKENLFFLNEVGMLPSTSTRSLDDFFGACLINAHFKLRLGGLILGSTQ